MDSNAEPFIGLWDIYAQFTHSELLLQADGHYTHSFGGGMQMHWGEWSLREQEGHHLLWLQLEDAQPKAYFGLYGMVPVNWPAYEAWAISEVQPNQINLYGGMMVRKSFTPQQTIPSMEPQIPTQYPSFPPPTAPQMPPPVSPMPPPPQSQIPVPPQNPSTALPLPSPADYAAGISDHLPPPPQTPYKKLPPLNYSALSHPPPPNAQSMSVMKQWQDNQLQLYQMQQLGNTQMQAAQHQAFLNNSAELASFNTQMFAAHQKAMADMQRAREQGVQQFISSMNGGK